MSSILKYGKNGSDLESKIGLYNKYPAYHGQSTKSISSTCLEVVDFLFVRRGEMSFYIVPVILFAAFLIYVFYLIYVSSAVTGALSGASALEAVFIIFIVLFCFFSLLFSLYVLILMVKQEFLSLAISPVRFNRKVKKVFYFNEKRTVCEISWTDIVFKVHPTVIFGVPHNNIVAYKKAEQGKLECLFVLGFMGNKDNTLSYWEFIRCYMEDDVVEHLSDLVDYCQDLPLMRQSFIAGFQTLIRFSSRLSWIATPVSVPYYLVAAVFRRLIMSVAKKAVWPEEVDQLCVQDNNDPVQVDSSNNPKDLWGYTFHDLSESYYTERDQRTTAAHERIELKLNKKYV